jgi:hypothetical protein
MSWHEVGGALGVAELAQARGGSVAKAAWQYVAGQPSYPSGQPGEFRWVCPDCGEVVSDRGSGGRSPAEDEQDHAERCQRLAAAVAQWLAQGD